MSCDPAIEIFIGDIGTNIKLTVQEDGVAVDVSTATTKEYIFKDPDGVVTSVTAVFDSDGTDGILSYVTLSSNLNVAGIWEVQAKVVMGGTFYSTAASFKVVQQFA